MSYLKEISISAIIKAITDFFNYLFLNVLVISESRLEMSDKFPAWIKVVLASAPVAFLLDSFDTWFVDNKKFLAGVVFVILINMFSGMWRHKKLGTFKYDILMIKTIYMCLVTSGVYFVLEITRANGGDNIATETLKYVIQVITLLYPGSKALKSFYVITDGDFPPEWIMKKIYNYEKTGDLSQFTKGKHNPKSEEEEEENEDISVDEENDNEDPIF